MNEMEIRSLLFMNKKKKLPVEQRNGKEEKFLVVKRVALAKECTHSLMYAS
jgi:hypothetical protein